jgi:hypothetical protein
MEDLRKIINIEHTGFLAFVFIPCRPRRRWQDNIKMDLQEVGGGCGDWIELAQDRNKWRDLVSAVMNFRVP